MGEVYLALDTQLDRPVALKILPAEIARDQQRLHRFLQESRAAAALSHPNIAHIYEIGEAEGAHFIAMEYVEGTPLDKKIGGRPLHIAEILDIAVQIADALDEAHAKGIVHRDIKSSNIMITSRGRVKVLDFGLAKLATPAGVTDRTSDSELATRVKTSPGVVMGTVNFMSPEQALGREVDQRSDIFSFGVVLYEMATGRLPFAGDTVTETIDRIAHSQPEAIARLNYDVPAELEVIVKKALRKDREERYQTIHDALVDLKELRRELDISAGIERSLPPSSRSGQVATEIFDSSPSSRSGIVAPTSTTAVPTAHPTSSAEYIASGLKRNKKAFVLITVAVIVIGAAVLTLAVVALWKYNTKRIAELERRPGAPSAIKITRLTSTGKAIEAAVSPDGKWVVYAVKEGNQRSLHVRQIATTSDVQIVAPAVMRMGRQTFSADGNYLFYNAFDQNSESGILYQVPSLGGIPRKILTDIISPITLSPDGKRIAFIRNNESVSGEDQLMVANIDGSAEQKLAGRRVDKWFNSGGCGWSPDAKVIACPGGSYTGGFHTCVIIIDAASGAQTEFTQEDFSDMGRVSWLSDGSGIVVNAAAKDSQLSQLWLIGYPNGDARRISSDLNDYSGTSLTADSKTLVTVQNDPTANIWIAPITNPETARQITTGKLDGTRGLAFAPDGRIVYTVNTQGTNDIWIMNADGNNQRPLVTDPTEDEMPTVTPDGRYVVFTSERSGFPSVWRMDLDGANLKQLTSGGQEDYTQDVSPDGRWVLFDSWRSGRRTPWKVSIDGGEPTQVIDKFTSSPRFSPDGKWIASYFQDEQAGSPWRIMIAPVDGKGPVKVIDLVAAADQIAIAGGVVWSPDGRSIWYVNTRDGTPNLYSQSIEGGAPKQLTKFADNGAGIFNFSRDGKTIAFMRATERSDVVLISDFR
jgi:eukaryotic-like serine/threonine-protein kinase